MTSLGLRTETVQGLPALDIKISEVASTLVEFDGLGGAYDGSADFSVHIDDDVVGAIDTGDSDGDGDFTDIHNGLTSANFWGIPLAGEATADTLENDTLIPDLELLRFDGINEWGDIFDGYEIGQYWLNGIGGLRESEVSWSINYPLGWYWWEDDGGDQVYVGDAEGPATPYEDLMFGLSGNDSLSGLQLTDVLDGGSGNDTLLGVVATICWWVVRVQISSTAVMALIRSPAAPAMMCLPTRRAHNLEM